MAIDIRCSGGNERNTMVTGIFYTCEVLEAGPQPGDGVDVIAVNLNALEPQEKALGWRTPGRMHSEVLTTALMAICANLRVSVCFEKDDGTGLILAFNLRSRSDVGCADATR